MAAWRAKPNIVPGRELTVDDVFHVLNAMLMFTSSKRVSRALRHLETAHGWVISALLRSGIRDRLKDMWGTWLGKKKNTLVAIRNEVAASILKQVGPKNL